MQTDDNHHESNCLDSYSILIVSKYFNTKNDYINLICVCKKFKETTEKLRYNPIPVTTKKLFPKMQTHYIYSREEKKLNKVKIYEVWYVISYGNYLQTKKTNTKYHCIKYTKENRKKYGNSIPNCVNILDIDCFRDSRSTTLTIPTNVTKLGLSCFYWCGELKQIELPSSINVIPPSCFYYCTSLTSITLPLSIKSLGTYCFYYCKSLTEIVIPNSVTSIDTSSFNCCESLQSITFPSELLSLGTNAFSKCSKLSNVDFPSTLTSIGSYCFNGCVQLESVEIPKSVQSVGFDCFYKCESLTHLSFSSDINEITFKVSYDDSIFYKQFGISCNNVKLSLGGLTRINNEMKQLQKRELILPEIIVELDDFIFINDEYYTSIIIPTTVTSIGNSCFEQCLNLVSLSIPSSVKSIGDNCFVRCSNLTSITIPTTITSIGTNCFYGCKKLSNLPDISTLNKKMIKRCPD